MVTLTLDFNTEAMPSHMYTYTSMVMGAAALEQAVALEQAASQPPFWVHWAVVKIPEH